MNAQPYPVFENRMQAGSELAEAVAVHKPKPPMLVLGLPRGGVPLAAAVARRFNAPLDVLVVRKVGMPGDPELAIGAIAGAGVRVRNDRLPPHLVSDAEFARLAQLEMHELARREQLYRVGRGPLPLRDAFVVLVDDGLATGATMLAAIAAARLGGARRVMVAVPVASPEAAAVVRRHADELVVLLTPERLDAVGAFYRDFAQLTDAQVIRLLREAC